MEEALVHARQVVANKEAESEHGEGDDKPGPPAELGDQASQERSPGRALSTSQLGTCPILACWSIGEVVGCK